MSNENGVLSYKGFKNTLNKFKNLFERKQDKISGTDGTLLGLNNGEVKSSIYPSNPNILDNGYFLDPINQRGKTEYSEGNYTIDRWVLIDGQGYVKVTKNGIQIIKAETAQHLTFQQVVDFRNLLEKTVTFSILEFNNRLTSTTVTIPSYEENIDSINIGASAGYIDIIKGRNTNLIHVRYVVNSSTEANLIAAKLELGDKQTLTHKEGEQWVLNDPPPNYQQELAKCQRYQVVFGSNNATTPVGIGQARTESMIATVIPINTPLHKNPTVSLTGELRFVNQAVTLKSSNVSLNMNAGNSSIIVTSTVSNAVTGAPYEVSLEAGNFMIIDANL